MTIGEVLLWATILPLIGLLLGIGLFFATYFWTLGIGRGRRAAAQQSSRNSSRVMSSRN